MRVVFDLSLNRRTFVKLAVATGLGDPDIFIEATEVILLF